MDNRLLSMITPLPCAGFHSSYAAEDVIFLLTPIEMAPIAVEEKEWLLQSGLRHYSEMISHEAAPEAEYMRIYGDAMSSGGRRMGREIAGLACAIRDHNTGPITLVSLVRAGVPIGVLLVRALRHLGVDAAHYAISIIRDRGLDRLAMRTILACRDIEGVIFVDGWTGKGAIAAELATDFRKLYDREARLVVLADPCGRAWLAASGDDWLIPSGMLGATISGLISRSILDANTQTQKDRFHGCIVWHHLAPFDVSRSFIDEMWPHIEVALREIIPAASWTQADRIRQQNAAGSAIACIASHFGIDQPNRIKPGLAEAARAVMRRSPERVLAAATDHPDLAALSYLARRSGVPIEVVPEMIAPYHAVTLIRKAG